MSNHETEFGNNELAEAYRVLHQALEDERLHELADSEGPLKVSELDRIVVQSEAFEQFVRDMGWPSGIEDGAIVPPPRFADDQEFLDAFSPEKDPEQGSGYLNNFKVWLAVEPSSAPFDPNAPMTATYAAKPALHRAYVVAPEFMNALRITYNALPRPDWSTFPVRESFKSTEDRLVLEGMHVAYQLCARLLKTTDPDLEVRTLFGKPSGSRIDDAATALAE